MEPGKVWISEIKKKTLKTPDSTKMDALSDSYSAQIEPIRDHIANNHSLKSLAAMWKVNGGNQKTP